MNKTNKLMVKIDACDDFCPEEHGHWASEPYYLFDLNKRVETCPICGHTKLTHRGTFKEYPKNELYLLQAAYPGIEINKYITDNNNYRPVKLKI